VFYHLPDVIFTDSQTPIVSLASTQSILLSHQVYLTDRIDNNNRERMAHMKCVCFLQNSEDSLGALEAELKEPKYGEYYLCQWVNAISFWHFCGPHSSSLPFRLQQYLDQDRDREIGRRRRIRSSERSSGNSLFMACPYSSPC
jgi:Sec1 family